MCLSRERRHGLSPLARGTVPFTEFFTHKIRFIPARAGNGFTPIADVVDSSVYPRSRGERNDDGGGTTTTHGLSPLARGTEWGTGRIPLRSRFIPARAGNRAGYPYQPALRAVYPRSRGEQKPPRSPVIPAFGLSPLARGTGYQAS